MRIKVSALIVLILILTCLLVLKFNARLAAAEPTTWVVDDDGPADFHTIQEAINAAISGDTVYVKAGTYDERITIGKTLTVVGESRDDVVITRNVKEIPAIVNIAAGNVTFSGFTVQGNRSAPSLGGISGGFDSTVVNNKVVSCYEGLYASDHCNFSYNIITDNFRGVWMSVGKEVFVSHNEIYSNGVGIYLYEVDNATIRENKFYNNSVGVSGLYNGPGGNMSIVENVFTLNGFGIYCYGNPFWHLVVYHNDFIDNSVAVAEPPPPDLYESIWDDVYPSGGNYWSDYSGVDAYSGVYQNETGRDGIGDTPYVIDEYNIDRYPLMTAYPPIQGDVNSDGKVRVDDILAIALAFGSNYGDPRYEPILDINRDLKIRVDDLLIAVLNFGKGSSDPCQC